MHNENKYFKPSLGDAHKHVWLALPDGHNFCSRVRVRCLASIKPQKKLKGWHISFSHPLVLKIGIFLTWENFKSYILTKSNLALLWQWLAAWKPLKLGSHVSWRRLYVLFRICYFRYLKLNVVLPEHFICHAKEKDLKIDSAEFQHKSANEFSQKKSHSIKLKTVF